MRERQSSAIRSLRLAMVAVVVLPALALGYAGWMNWRHTLAVADDRIERTALALQEHAAKVFETVERSISEANEIVRGMPDSDIAAHEEDLHLRLRLLVESLPQFKSMWIFDRNGRALANSLVHPAPAVSFADRDYFRSHLNVDAGTFVGEVLKPRDPYPAGDFFSVSQRRPSPDGAFAGVVQISVRPDYFQQFYRRLNEITPGAYAALLRADGAVLARYPQGEGPVRMPETMPLAKAMRDHPGSGFVTQASNADGRERRLHYIRLEKYPLYVLAGLETAAIRGEWLKSVAGYALVAAAAVALLLAVLALALRRTRSFYAEVQRREAAEQALRHAKRLEAIGQLTGGVAHDFNNLLMVVTGNIDRMRRDLGETRFKRQLDMIEAAAQRGQNLTRQLLSFSRRQNLQPTVFDIVERVQALDPMLRSSLRGDIELVIDVPQEALAVRADSAELELAILNLAVNARDAMPGGGRLRVAVKPVVLHGEEEHDALSGEFVALTLADTGVGIAPEVRDRIFEPFFTTKDIDKGTGLGLSQVYGFVKQSGGTVTVESERGQGTSFTLYLPRASVSAVESKAAPRERPARRGRGSILLVEDNAQVAEVATGLLEELGYDVTAVTGAQAALDRLAQGGEFDLVFSDIVMPGGMSGVQLAQTIAQRHPGLPVVLTTGYHDSLQGKAPAGVPILQKPYDSADLDRAMRAALARRAA